MDTVRFATLRGVSSRPGRMAKHTRLLRYTSNTAKNLFACVGNLNCMSWAIARFFVLVSFVPRDLPEKTVCKFSLPQVEEIDTQIKTQIST